MIEEGLKATRIFAEEGIRTNVTRITSYNVCYTKLLRDGSTFLPSVVDEIDGTAEAFFQIAARTVRGIHPQGIARGA